MPGGALGSEKLSIHLFYSQHAAFALLGMLPVAKLACDLRRQQRLAFD